MAKYLGLASAKDVENKRVRTTSNLTNAYVSIPKGTEATVIGSVRNGKIAIKGQPCKCCGIAVIMGGLKYGHLELVGEDSSNG